MNTYNMKQYQQNQVNTASPEQILLMLYDGAIRFVRRAITGIEEKKPELKLSGIAKAMAIISEFSNSLNREIGGQIADDLDALYDFMLRELTAANIHNNIEKLQTVENLLADLRQTWREAVEINRKETVPSEIVAPRINQATTTEQVAVVKEQRSQEQAYNTYQGTGTYKPFLVSY